jgi:osmoprotectant transport system permease protein
VTSPSEPAPVAAYGARLAICNPMLFVSALAATAAALGCGFIEVAPNRLVSGTPIMLWNAAGGGEAAALGLFAALLLALSLTPRQKATSLAAAALGSLWLLTALAALGHAALVAAGSAGPSARISAGPAFWIIAGCATFVVVDAVQRLASVAAALSAVVTVACGGVALAGAGIFAELSIAREYMAHQSLFAAALARHMALVAGSVVPGLAIGFPLGIAAVRTPRLQAPLFAVLNLLQTVPSIALFGLLLAPLAALAKVAPALAALGVGGVGVAPALIALVLYALLPIVRNTTAGLSGVEPAVIDAARGMGLSRSQILWRIELPLALPVLLAGLRIVLVQTIGLAVVAALIGAGGLGTFIFEGLGQYALDLVLLGALPAIFLALAADFALRVLAALLPQQIAR